MKEIDNLLEKIDNLQQDIDHYKPLSEDLLMQLRHYYRIGLTYTSNALEGNTLTESETRIILEEGITVSGKPLIHHLEAVGMSNAYDFMYTLKDEKVITEDMIKQLHWIFNNQIDAMRAGRYRKVKVFIYGSKFPLPYPEEISRLMQEWVAEMQLVRKELHPIIFAALAHKDFVYCATIIFTG